jgi:adenylate cyclase
MNGHSKTALGFEHIEKRIWQITLLALAIILYLTLSVLGFQFHHFLGESGLILFSEDSYEFSVFLCILILLFCAYVALQERRLLRLSRDLYIEKEERLGLSEDVETLGTLLEVSSKLGAQLGLAGILHTIAEGVLRCFKGDHISIMLLDKASARLRAFASLGEREKVTRNVTIPVGKGIAGKVVKEKKHLLIQGAASLAEFPGTPEKSTPIASSMCVPLSFRSRPIGVLNVSTSDEQHPFTEKDLKVLCIFGNNAAVAIHNALLRREKAKRIHLEQILERHHSPQVARALMRGIGSEVGGREKAVAAVLFADIRGFSTIANLMVPEDMMSFLDQFYGAMHETVSGHGGTVSKFIGDEVMAFFLGSGSSSCSHEDALHAALEIRDRFPGLIRDFADRAPAVRNLGIGIGIHAGEVFLGNVGSERRCDYTVIGSTVNLAKRLCSYARPGQILTTAETLQKANGRIQSRFVQHVFFKGASQRVEVYKVVSQNQTPGVCHEPISSIKEAEEHAKAHSRY